MSRQKNFNDNFYDNTSIEFEILLNNLKEWENNPIETSRYCLKNLYNIIRYQQKSIESIDENKISRKEFNSEIKAKVNTGDFMSAINDISENIEKLPKFEQIKLALNDNYTKKEINDLLKNRPTLEEVKTYLEKGNININIDKIKEDLNRNFINFNNLSDILSTKASKETVINFLNQKANISDLEKINKELKNFNSINHKIQEIENNFKEIFSNINQKIEKINNENNTENKSDYNKAINRLNEFDLKFNNFTDTINSLISDLDKKINLIINKYESIDKDIKSYENNFKDLIIKQKENKSSIISEDNKVNSILKDINKIYGILENKLNKYEIESINAQIKELITKSKIYSNQKYMTFQEIDNIYNSICNDIHQKFIDIDNYTQNLIKKIKLEIKQDIEAKVSSEEMIIVKKDLTQIKILLEQKPDLKDISNIENITNIISQNYVNKKEFGKFVEIYQNNIEIMKNDILLKSNIQETMAYLKNKADINDINNALNQIHDVLDTKLSFQDFTHALNNINRINSALVQNNQVGKWIWESGLVKNNHFIFWEIQKINNCPENFIWNQNSDTIIVKQKGIYSLNLAIFMNNSAIIQLYINGEKILSKNNNDKEKSGIDYDSKNNNINESLTGININEFLLLQEKSRISIFYDGSDNVKGFLELKMLYNF